MLLAERSVLIVDDDAESVKVLRAHLSAQGARVDGAPTGAAALELASKVPPDAVICELALPDFDGRSLISSLRAVPGCETRPALALTTEPPLVGYARALGAGFEKYLLKPARLEDVTDALCCVLGDSRARPAGVLPSLAQISEAIAVHDYRALLGAMNASTRHRYTGLLRFDGPELSSIWTFDRERPSTDPFPLRLRTADTPCELLRETRTTVALEDAWQGQRPAGRGASHGMRALVGVPLAGDDGALYGALCHFDPEPRAALPHALDLLERVGRMFRFLSVKDLG